VIDRKRKRGEERERGRERGTEKERERGREEQRERERGDKEKGETWEERKTVRFKRDRGSKERDTERKTQRERHRENEREVREIRKESITEWTRAQAHLVLHLSSKISHLVLNNTALERHQTYHHTDTHTIASNPPHSLTHTHSHSLTHSHAHKHKQPTTHTHSHTHTHIHTKTHPKCLDGLLVLVVLLCELAALCPQRFKVFRCCL
jgi:hypothetical protein